MAPKPLTLPRHINPSNPVSLGSRIAVFWPKDNTFYAGKITRFLQDGKVKVSYDDGDFESLFLQDQVWEYVTDAAIYPRQPNLPPSTQAHSTPSVPTPVTQSTNGAGTSSHRKKKARTGTPKPSSRKRSASPKEPASKEAILPDKKRPKVHSTVSPPVENVSVSKPQPSSLKIQATSLPSNAPSQTQSVPTLPPVVSKTALATKQAVASLGDAADVLQKDRSCLTSSTLTVPVSPQKRATPPGKFSTNKDEGKPMRQKKITLQAKDIVAKEPTKATVPPVVQKSRAQVPKKTQKQRVSSSIRRFKPIQPAPSRSSLVPQVSPRPLPQLARPIVSGVPLSGMGTGSSTVMASASENVDVDKLKEGAMLEDRLKNWAGQIKTETIEEAVRPLISSYSLQLNNQSTRVAKIGEQVSNLTEDIRDIDKRCQTLRADVDFIESEALSTPAVKRMLDSRHGHQKAQIRKALESYFDEMKMYIAELVKSHLSLLEKRITEQVVKKSDQLFETVFADVCKDVKGDGS